MRPTSSLLALAAGLLLMSESAAAKNADWTQVTKYIGCFKSSGGLSFATQDKYNSQGSCRDKCASLNARYSGTTDFDKCYCGDTLPPESDKVDDSVCDQQCAGFPTDPCGSRNGDFTIYLTDGSGTDPRLNDGTGQTDGPSTTTTSKSSVPVTTITQQGTVFVTTIPQTGAPSPKSSGGGGGSGMNKAGVAAGVVVGVLVAIAIGAGAFIFIRKQRRRKVEEDYRRSVAVREYQQKKPETDLRLDPVIMQRRMSDGSIADNHDYSRRILKVTNPDGN